VREAVARGVDLRGFVVWSLLDAFEWQVGYSRRYGMVFVDYGTQRRTLKDSAAWYRDVIAQNGRNVPEMLFEQGEGGEGAREGEVEREPQSSPATAHADWTT
jgi:hypothetical protein